MGIIVENIIKAWNRIKKSGPYTNTDPDTGYPICFCPEWVYDMLLETKPPMTKSGHPIHGGCVWHKYEYVPVEDDTV